MDDNEIKAAAVNQSYSKDDVKPGAMQIGGTQTQRPYQERRQSNAVNSIAYSTEQIDCSSPLVQKLRGIFPNGRETVGIASMHTTSLPVYIDDSTLATTTGPALVTQTNFQRNRNANEDTAKISATETINEHSSCVDINDDNNPLIRKLRGELPAGWTTSGVNRGDLGVATSPLVSITPRTDVAHTSPLKTEKSAVLESAGARIPRNGDLESAEYDIIGTTFDLAIALPVDEVEAHTPTAVEFDLDAKPTIKSTKWRLYLYTFLALSTVVIGAVGAAIGVTITKETPHSNRTVAANKNREYVSRFVTNEQLDDMSSPYRKALDWISNIDPMARTPDNPRFVQRYILAYFHFATSAKQPWASDCAPSDTSEDKCILKVKHDEDRTSTRVSFRWLSNQDECDWAGISCDSYTQIFSINLGAYF